MKEARAWLELVTSLPTENATERMRAWRTLKTTGAGVLRDGVYVFPDRPDLEEVLARLAGEIHEAGGSAHVLRVEARDPRQAEALRRGRPPMIRTGPRGPRGSRSRTRRLP